MTVQIQRALVTGGAGFIGSHIAEALVNQGCHVTVLDNLSTGHIANLKGIEAAITFIEGDIRDSRDVGMAIEQCDAVFHHAAVVSVTQTVSDPVASTEVNDLGTLRVLDAARLNGVRRVVLASSSAVYGDDPKLPKEESFTSRPLSPYAVQKLTNEHYAELYFQLYGLETVCLRYFNVYGPRQDPSSPYSGVISIFMKCAAANTAPTVYGDGRQTRDFVFVKDIVQANLLAAQSAAAAGMVFNVGSGKAIDINALWQKIARLARCECPAAYAEARQGDIIHSLASIEKARNFLGFNPSMAFNEGLAQTYRWYEQTR
jgi:nucleoside-diphosphate-sugar epimerase